MTTQCLGMGFYFLSDFCPPCISCFWFIWKTKYKSVHYSVLCQHKASLNSSEKLHFSYLRVLLYLDTFYFLAITPQATNGAFSCLSIFLFITHIWKHQNIVDTVPISTHLKTILSVPTTQEMHVTYNKASQICCNIKKVVVVMKQYL